MSAPDTNISKQKRRHRPSLVGIGVAVALVGLIVLLIAMWSGSAEAAPAAMIAGMAA